MADKNTKRSVSIEEENLAEKIQLYPCLFDKSVERYKEKEVVRNAWNEVAINLKMFLKQHNHQ